MCASILVQPILVDAKEFIIGGRGALSGEVAHACSRSLGGRHHLHLLEHLAEVSQGNLGSLPGVNIERAVG